MINKNLARASRIGQFLGPAFVAAVAYVDPGNFAANFSAGAQFGYSLLWVLVIANLMAMLIQYLSAKVGIVTGKSLPEIIAERLGKRSRLAYWLQAEAVAIATDLAEVVGGALALQILFGIPLIFGGLITGVVSIILLLFHKDTDGGRIFERVIMGLMLIIPIGFFVGLWFKPPNVNHALTGLMPTLNGGSDMILLASAMLGATVMPHVVYLHSALTRDRYGKNPKKQIAALLHATKIDVGIAMVVAGSVNIAMLLLAASALSGLPMTDDLTEIYKYLGGQVAPLVAWLFAISLLVAGLTSTAVGAQAGAVMMEGLLHKRIPMLLRRVITITPALIIIALGINPTDALIWSQAVLSIGIPFALVPLILATRNHGMMASYRNSKLVTAILTTIVVIISILNLTLVSYTLLAL